MAIEIRSAPHRKVVVTDITHNPHRDLSRNPVKVERVEELLDSFARTGFWDNIVVREHPTREGKYELAYGHNRLAALKSRDVDVDSITIPVAKLSDFDMYCAMVDENEMQGAPTPAIVIENINKGCDLVEKAFKQVGPEGTWEQFNKAMGRVVPVGTTRDDGQGFEQARTAFFDGEGLGRRFLAPLLPGVEKMRKDNLSTVLASRYGKSRVAAKTTKAKKKRDTASKTTNKAQKKKLEDEADALEAEAARIGKGAVSEDILMLFDTPNMMTNFVAAVRKLHITPEYHKQAAMVILKAKVRDERIERELLPWWDEISGTAAKRRATAKAAEDAEKMRKALHGVDFNEHLLAIKNRLLDLKRDVERAIPFVHMANHRGHQIIEGMVPVAGQIFTLIERSRATLGADTRDITPATKMLTHQK